MYVFISSIKPIEQHTQTKATGNSRFETEKFPPPRSAKNSRKFPLSTKLNYHSLCNTSTLYMACIPYVVFMGRDVGCVLSVLLYSITESSANSNCELVKLFVCVGCIEMISAWT